MTELENNAFKQVEGEYFTLKRKKAELEKTRNEQFFVEFIAYVAFVIGMVR